VAPLIQAIAHLSPEEFLERGTGAILYREPGKT